MQKNQFPLKQEPALNHQNLLFKSSQSDKCNPNFQQKPRINQCEQAVSQKEKELENNQKAIDPRTISIKNNKIIIQEVSYQQVEQINQKPNIIEEIHVDKKEDIQNNYTDNYQDQKVKESSSKNYLNKKPSSGQNEDVKNIKIFSQTFNFPQQSSSQQQFQSNNKVMTSQINEKYQQSEITNNPRSEITKQPKSEITKYSKSEIRKNPQPQSEINKYPNLISQSFQEKNKFPSREFQFEQQNDNSMMEGTTLFSMKFSCNFCQLVSSDKIIYLECKHLYHDYCLKELVQGQLSNPKFEKIACLCGTDIKSKLIKANFKSLSEVLFAKQIEIIKNKYSKYLIKCQNCQFFCFIGNQHISKCYCHQCQMNIKRQ